MPFPVDETSVRNAEVALGAALPASYRQSMMTENGGEVDSGEDSWFLYPIRDESDRKRLARTCNDIVTETRTGARWQHFPAQAVAIADNGAGDRLVFLRSRDRFGPEVHAWSHETGELSIVAQDFAELERL